MLGSGLSDTTNQARRATAAGCGNVLVFSIGPAPRLNAAGLRWRHADRACASSRMAVDDPERKCVPLPALAAVNLQHSNGENLVIEARKRSFSDERVRNFSF